MKVIKFEEEARELLKSGVAKLERIVGSTMGAAGKPVIIDSVTNNPYITADGVTVSEEVELSNQFENLGCNLVKNAARQVNQEVGDGTTTATVLANAFIQNDRIIKNQPPLLVKRGIEKAVEHVKNTLKLYAREIDSHETLCDVATVSARGDRELGTLIADAFAHIGKDGQILVEEGRGEESSLEKVTGYQMDGGYFTDAYINNKKRNVVDLENPRILVTNIEINDANIFSKLLNDSIKKDGSFVPLVVIAPGIDERSNVLFVSNVGKGVVGGVFIEAPEYGSQQDDILRDLAFITGGTFYDKDLGMSLKDVTLDTLGTCTTFICTQHSSVFIGGLKEADNLIEDIQPTTEFNKKRISRLQGKLAKLFVGAKSYVELREKRDRAEDAVGATRAALDGGIVPGGGVALFRASLAIPINMGDTEGEKAGIRLTREALQYPLKRILNNLFNGSVSVSKIKRFFTHYDRDEDVVLNTLKYQVDVWAGYDVKNLKYCNLFTSGIIDPVKVTITALEAAASVSTTLLLTNGAICITPDEKENLTFGN